MQNDRNWIRWVMQTAQTWEDIQFIIEETGISKIDHEHKRITDYIIEENKLLFKLEKKFSINLLEHQKNLMQDFNNYIIMHFKEEEDLHIKFKIPGVEQQKEQHNEILEMLKETKFEFESGRVTSAFRQRIRILEKIIFHINTLDKEVFKHKYILKYILESNKWEDASQFIRFIHIPIIDQQHKTLTEKIIKLVNLIKSNSSKKSVDKKVTNYLEELLNFIKLHFDTEVKIISKYNIPEGHIQDEQHRKFIEFVLNNKKSLENNEMESLAVLKEKLMLWWIQHINIYDYRTFRQRDWITPIFVASKKKEDVLWLIPKIGIKEVDKDHFHFIDMVYDNIDLFERDEDSAEIIKERISVMKSLTQYAKDHFKREERVMQEMNIPDRRPHMLEHQSILESLAIFSKYNSMELIDFSGSFKRKVLAIWIWHISDTDASTFGVHYEE